MRSASLPAVSPGPSVCECGAAGSASGQTACPVRPTLLQSQSRHGHTSPLRPGAHLHPSYRSGCMFLFYLLGVGLPCHSIFCQFWLCEEAQCVYLRCHLGSLSRTMKWHSSYTVINGLNIKFMCTDPGTFHHLKQYGEKQAVLREEDNSGLTLGLLNFLYFTLIFILEDQHCHDPL